jgi:hypothetical protein
LSLRQPRGSMLPRGHGACKWSCWLPVSLCRSGDQRSPRARCSCSENRVDHRRRSVSVRSPRVSTSVIARVGGPGTAGVPRAGLLETDGDCCNYKSDERGSCKEAATAPSPAMIVAPSVAHGSPYPNASGRTLASTCLFPFEVVSHADRGGLQASLLAIFEGRVAQFC